ncbi:hypothetical protein KBA73_00975 [Patescibacteria group bacterium]|nr:hypothetical protein [Patescibacteria group bacterium]
MSNLIEQRRARMEQKQKETLITEAPTAHPSISPASKEKELAIQQARIADLRKDIERANYCPATKACLAAVHPAILERCSKNETFPSELKSFDEEMQKDPAFAEYFIKIVVSGEARATHEHGTKQIEQLRAQYLGDRPWLHPLDTLQKREKLATFQKFMSELRPVRGDGNRSITTYKSPRALGSSISFGPADIFVQADRYVYASFDRIKHHMTDRFAELALLDEEAIPDDAQIVLKDIADSGQNDRDHRYRDYLNNIFPYKAGKEMLALYLATVFESPEEAEAFFQFNNKRQNAQRWHEVNLFVYPPTLPLNEEQQAKRLNEIYGAMKAIYTLTRIEPPLCIEVRIPDQATKIGTIKNGE